MDYANMVDDKKVSLLAKYMPREKSEFSNIAFEIADKMFEGSKFTKMKKYRKMISDLNVFGIKTTTETLMCGKRYRDIDFSKVPSLCMQRNRKAFLNEKIRGCDVRYYDEDRMIARENLIETNRVNGRQLFPYEICKKCMSLYMSESEISVLDKQWNDLRMNMLKLMEKSGIESDNTVVMSDVSGSMTVNGNLPLAVSISLGIMFSELCNESYKNLILTFDSNPIFLDLSNCKSIHEKVKKLMGAPWGGTTNILKAMELILNVAKNKNVDKIPNLLIVSDMQFDIALDNKSKTHYQIFEHMFKESGGKVGKNWKMPKITFWNVNSSTKGFPVKAKQPNTYLMSGFSPSLFKYLFNGEQKEDESPQDMLKRILLDPEFYAIREKLNSMKTGVFSTYVFVKPVVECKFSE